VAVGVGVDPHERVAVNLVAHTHRELGVRSPGREGSRDVELVVDCVRSREANVVALVTVDDN
jgi:hypothetical protein